MKPLQSFLLLCGLFLVSGSPAVHAQAGPEKGTQELQIWTTGGYGIKGIDLHTGVWTAGLRYGLVLTAPHGPGFLRGRLEYAADLAPMFVVFQPAGTAHGVSVSPFNLKWDLDRYGRVAPYVEVSAGSLITNRPIPAGVSRENFITSSTLGVNFIGAKLHWSVGLRFSHISDSGLTPVNPGINVLQLRLGIGLFRGKHGFPTP
jgi:hypothetical protein